MPEQGATATLGPFTDVIFSNVVPGPTVITATAPGIQIAPVTVDIQGGQHNTIVLMQPVE